MAFENLLKPIKIGPVTVKNRIAMAPCNVHFSQSGLITDQYIAYYAARAKGGLGLTVVGAVSASRKESESLSLELPYLFEYVHAGMFQEVVEACHEYGSTAFVQMTLGTGRQARRPKGEIVAPSPIALESHPELTLDAFKKVADRFVPLMERTGETYPVPREMTVKEILEREEEMVKAAKLAMFAGFDGIEIHAPHGYLVHQFLSPRCNKRTDAYGGSFEKRMRFLLELVKKTKDVVKDQCAVGVRIAAAEHMPGGFTSQDVNAIAKACEKEGLDYVHLSDGCWEALKYFFPEEERDHLLDEAKVIKEGLKIPIITPSIHDPEHAEAGIKAGKTDMISLGRQLMVDPEWPNKVKEGRIKEITRCHRDGTCILWLMTEGKVRCPYNPNLGRERYMPEYWPQKKSGKLPTSLLKKREEVDTSK